MKQNPRIKPIEQATQKSWDEWMVYMGRINAKELNHHEIATKVLEELMGKLENPAWWAQAVAVAYEQESGRRLPGQQPDGSFQTSVSKATGISMKELMDAWVIFARNDQEVNHLVSGTIKVGGTEKRLTWRTKSPDGSTVNVISEPKANGSASVIVQLLNVPTQDESSTAKERWATVINRFVNSLGKQ